MGNVNQRKPYFSHQPLEENGESQSFKPYYLIKRWPLDSNRGPVDKGKVQKKDRSKPAFFCYVSRITCYGITCHGLVSGYWMLDEVVSPFHFFAIYYS